MSSFDPRTDRLVWMDLEMTGLDPRRHVIVEVAAVVTDANLNILGEGVDLVVHAGEEELAEMDATVRRMHERSGLTAEIRESTMGLREAEDAVLELIATRCPGDHTPLLAGNSIATDRAFIREHMPRVDEALHYRMIDVSSVKELTRRWLPRVYQRQPAKGMAHRAQEDIVESIRELDYYRRAAFARGVDSASALRAQEESVARYQRFVD